MSRMTQRVQPARVPPEKATDTTRAPAEPSFEPAGPAIALPARGIEPTPRPNRRRRRESSRANLWGVDLRGLADMLLLVAVVLLLLAAVAAAVGVTHFAR